MKYNVKKIVFFVVCDIVLLTIGIIIGVNIKKEKVHPRFLENPHGKGSWYLEKGELSDLIYDNYWAFVQTSYIIIGEIPNCELYKIAAEVPKNDYDTENFFIDDEDYMYYHDSNGERKSIVAIDVSAFQDNVNWEMVKENGVDMAIIRVGYRGYGSGAIVEDDMYKMHIEEALDAGLKVGVYFYSQAINYDEGVEEAKFVLDAIKKYKIKGPVVIDTEMTYDDEARTKDLSNEVRTDSIIGFCETVKEASYEPMIYSNRNWFAQSLDMTRLGDYKLWLAQYANEPDFPYWYAGWQYTEDGYIYGIDGNVDLNVWFEE